MHVPKSEEPNNVSVKRYQLIKDGELVSEDLYPSSAQILGVLLPLLVPKHEWNFVGYALDPGHAVPPNISDAKFDPLFWTNGVRCDLKNNWLVLTVPDLRGSEFKEIRGKIKSMGFKWRRTLGFWSADYTHERAEDSYRDELMEILEDVRWSK